MRSPLSILFFAATTALLTSCLSESRDAQLDAVLNELIESNIPGAILVLDTPGANYEKAVGVEQLQTERSMNVNATLRLGSVTKTYMAALALTLVKDGTLSLNAPVSDYLSDDIMAKLPANQDPTLRQLMNHTTGIPDYYTERFYLEDWTRTDPITPDLVLYAIRGLEATQTNSQNFYYSNTNYHLLALAIEAATGEKLHDLLKTRIFDVTKLSQTYYDEAFPPGDTIHGYGSPLDANEDNYNFQENTGPDGGMYASAKETAHWIRQLFADDGQWLDIGNRMRAELITEKERKYQGMGVEVLESKTGARIYGHTGSVDGYLTAAFYIPAKDTTLVFHMNRSDDEAFTQALSKILKITLSSNR